MPAKERCQRRKASLHAAKVSLSVAKVSLSVAMKFVFL